MRARHLPRSVTAININGKSWHTHGKLQTVGAIARARAIGMGPVAHGVLPSLTINAAANGEGSEVRRSPWCRQELIRPYRLSPLRGRQALAHARG